MSHTTGPFKVVEIARRHRWKWDVDTEAGKIVAERMTKADAHLFAAASDMLEALHQCVGSLKALGASDGYASEVARAAIAKAGA